MLFIFYVNVFILLQNTTSESNVKADFMDQKDRNSRILVTCPRTERCLLWWKVEDGTFSTPGGKKKTTDKTIKYTAARELWEETRIKKGPMSFRGRGWVRHYIFDSETNLYCFAKKTELFVIVADSRYLETPNTNEMINATWFPFNQLPFEKTAAYFKLWAPRVLQGETVYIEVFRTKKPNSKILSYRDVHPDQQLAYPPCKK